MGLRDVAVFELEFAGDKIGGRAQLGIALGFESGQNILVHFAFFDDLGDQIALVGKAIGGSKGGKIADFGGSRCGTSGHASSIDVIDGRFWNRIGIVADVVFVMIAIFADAVRYDGAAVFQMDGVRRRTGEDQRPRQGELAHDSANKDDTETHSGAF